MFTIETGFPIVEDNKLQRLVEETVPPVPMPAGARSLLLCDGFRIVQADNKRSGLNFVQSTTVGFGRRNKALTELLRKR